MRRWITEHVGCVRSNTLGFIQEPSMLPERFVITEDLEEIKNLYIKMYSLEYAAKGSDSGQGGRTMKVEREVSQPSSLDMSEQTSMKRTSENSFGGQPQQQQKTIRQTMEKLDEEPIFGEMNAESNSSAIAQFAEFFVGLHTELRELLKEFTSASSLVVTECSEETVRFLLKLSSLCCSRRRVRAALTEEHNFAARIHRFRRCVTRTSTSPRRWRCIRTSRIRCCFLSLQNAYPVSRRRTSTTTIRRVRISPRYTRPSTL